MKTDVKVDSLTLGGKTTFIFNVTTQQSFWSKLANLFSGETSVAVPVDESTASSISNVIYNQIKRNKKKSESVKTEKKTTAPATMKANPKQTAKKTTADTASKPKRNYRKKPNTETSTDQAIGGSVTPTQQ